MRIGWITPTVGAFGAVREMIEVSNSLVRLGHTVTIFHPHGSRVKWLPCAAGVGRFEDIKGVRFDVMIGVLDWQPALFDILQRCDARLKCVCVLGFTPSPDIADMLRGRIEPNAPAWKMTRQAIEENMLILADSQWQVDWLREKAGVDVLPPFGGINLRMFSPRETSFDLHRPPRVLASNDPRKRKGTETVVDAVHLLQQKHEIDFDSYWGKRFDQQQLVDFLHNGDLFLDGHRRGGWCNPVIEAMACGCAVVCTQIGATSSFAFDEETALVVPPDDPERMAWAAGRLLKSEGLRRRLTMMAPEIVKQFDYERVVPVFAKALEERL